jgi:hypothetical protein
LVSFTGREGYEAYMADPERVAARTALAGVSIDQRVLTVSDVAP